MAGWSWFQIRDKSQQASTLPSPYRKGWNRRREYHSDADRKSTQNVSFKVEVVEFFTRSDWSTRDKKFMQVNFSKKLKKLNWKMISELSKNCQTSQLRCPRFTTISRSTPTNKGYSEMKW